MRDRLLSLPAAWWGQVTRARGGAKIAWGCLPVVVLLGCCVFGTAAGQSAGLIAIPPTRTAGPTSTPRLARNTPTPRLARNTPRPEGTRAPTQPTEAPAPTDAPEAAPPVTETPIIEAPTEAPAAAPPRGPVAPVGDDCPPDAPIKGNQGDEWIYHVPGGRSYSRTNPEQCFATEQDARDAGYRAAQN